MKRLTRSRQLFYLAILVVFLSSLLSSVILPGLSVSQKTDRQPNILFILTDDLDTAQVAYMPNLKTLARDEGISFDNFFVNVSVCCPSRVSILRGQYSHNTQILTNQGSNGGFETAYRLGIEKSTIATWLQAAGYRTALFGKYLNGYPGIAGKTYIPPGWDEWASAVDGNPYKEYNYTLNENGQLVSYGNDQNDYGADVYTQKAIDFIERAAKKEKPFFVYLAYYAPHEPATAAPRHANLFPGAKAPRTPSFNERDVSDKPQYLRQKKRLSQQDIARIDDLYRKRLQSLQAVDEALVSLVNALNKTKQLDNTYIFFTTDNGFHLGQHRLLLGKQTAYEEDIRVPLIVRGPGIPAGQTRPHLTGNIDLAPTFAELAGTNAADFVDGRSLTTLFKNAPSATTWRQAYLLEHWHSKNSGNVREKPPERQRQNQNQPDRRSSEESPIEVSQSKQRNRRTPQTAMPEYQGIRTRDYTYVEYETGEKELYDLRADRHQLNNLAKKANPKLLEQLAQRLHKLRKCNKASCRSAETT
jgi:arylsulfatase A-like enzyme